MDRDGDPVSVIVIQQVGEGHDHIDGFELLAKRLKGCADSFPSSFSFTDTEENIYMIVWLDDSGKGSITAILATSEADLLLRFDTDLPDSLLSRAS